MVKNNFSGAERRHFVRIPFWFITQYRPYPHTSQTIAEFKQGVGKDISVGGICFETKDKFGKETVLELEIDMPALQHAVTLVGQIVWSKHNEQAGHFVYGLAFLKINPNDIGAIKKIVETFA